MTLVSISEAARLTKRSRTTIYRYRDEGKISISSDHQGNPMIDTSELMRVFGPISLDITEHPHEQDGEHCVTDENDTVHPGKTTENTMLRESVRRLETALEEAKQREAWLQGQMERLTVLLTHANPPSQAPHAPWWKFWSQ